jgi:predicted TIM-barrel fold metal-dependent hydrolase
LASAAPGERDSPAARVVDLHHHWLPRELVDRMEDYLIEGFRVERRHDGAVGVYGPSGVEQLTVDPERWCPPEVQLADMDAAGMDVALLSAACYPSWLSLRAARLLNDAAADLQRAHPTRFVAMAHVPPFGEEGALAELERAARDLGLRGVCITTNFRGRYPDDEEYRPFLRKAAELDMPVFVHAAGAPVEHRNLLKHGLYRSLGRSFDHCLVTARLLYSGLLEELPGLRLVMPHLGGGFYAQARRILDVPRDPRGPRPDVPYRRLLDQLLFDTAPSFVWSPLEIGWAITALGPTHLALGSDYPVRNDPKVLADAVAHVRALAVDAADRERVAGGNALAFYGLAR